MSSLQRRNPRAPPARRKPSGCTEEGKLRFASRIVIVAIVNVTAYTAAAFIIQWHTLMPPPDSLTAAFFAFWGTEVAVLALKRIIEKKKAKGESAGGEAVG